MFKYENDICEYIRSYIKINKYDSQNQDIEIAFKEYLDKNNLILINKKTLSVINTLEEAENQKDYELKDRAYLEAYCVNRSCLGKHNMRCITCLLDYKLLNGDFKLVKKDQSND